MPTPSMTNARWIIANAAVVLLLAALWTPRGAAQVPPPPRAFTVVDSAHPLDAALRAYIGSLRFLTDHVSGDVRMLDADHTNLIIRIEPAVGNHLINASQLARSGRIVARLVNRGGDPISRFALAPKGKTYVWVQYIHEAWRGALISTDSLGAIVGRSPIAITPVSIDHPARVLQPVARFITDSVTTKVLAQCWPSCSPLGWCRGDTTRSATWY